jgi:iron complex transport system ATP-binding protein
MQRLLGLDEVEVIRDGNRILGPISWELLPGQRWVVLGPNGAGKTTFLQLLGALIHPTRGSVEILGEKLGQVDVFDLRPRIGISSSALHETLPGHERVVDLILTAAYGISGRWIEEYDLWDESRAKALLDIFGIRELSSRGFGSLSEGERKRAMIARSLMSDPEILLLDEPAAGLDLGGREDILGRISRYLDEENAPASVIVTHHIEEIPKGTTHVALLKNSKLYSSGPIKETLTSNNLNEVFNVKVRLSFDGERYFASSDVI